MVKKFFWSLHWLLFCFTVVIYVVVYGALSSHWVVGFLGLSIPFLMATHLILCLGWLLINKQKMWLSGLALLLSFPFWSRIYHFKSTEDKPLTADVTILSYNVMTFDVLNYLDGKDLDNAPKMIDWAVEQEADIKCFQEYYNYSPRPMFATLNRFKGAGYKHYTVLHPFHAQNEQNFFGLAIVSKFPIIDRGEMTFENQNGMVWADVKTPKGVVRVINLHLYSMGVRFNKFIEAYRAKNKATLRTESKYLLGRFKKGFQKRVKEIEQVEDVMAQSPYPVIVCGDFNETPFGYVYARLSRKLDNAFETTGHGFGFSYKNTPRFIRIDNQFFDAKKIKNIGFETRNDVKFSDHYPIVGRYQIMDKEE
jgi:endonuclease/exonuclease/phosphatase family metal-dependent hydrolase